MLKSYCHFLNVLSLVIILIVCLQIICRPYKASFVLYDLPYHVLDDPKIKLFQKSIRINRPLNLVSHNIIDIQMLEQISLACDGFKCAQVLRTVFLTGFFGFFRLSNLVSHALTSLSSDWS